jgi:hypothetical protein
MAGNPNPSPETRFKPGSTPNPGGMSAEVRARNDRVADMASQFREKLLSSTMEKLAAGEDPLELMSADLIRILKDSEDRAHGTPTSTVKGAGEDGDHLITFRTVYEERK